MKEKTVYSVYMDECDTDPHNVVRTEFIGGYLTEAEARERAEELNNNTGASLPFFDYYYVVESLNAPELNP